MLNALQKPNIYIYHEKQNELSIYNEYENIDVNDIIKQDPIYLIDITEFNSINYLEIILNNKKRDFNIKCLKTKSKDSIDLVDNKAGMLFHSKPKFKDDLEKDCAQIKSHHNLIVDTIKSITSSGLYNPAMNSLRYEISIVDENHTILYTNKKRRDLHGSNIIGKKCYSVFPCDSEKRSSECNNCSVRNLIKDQKSDHKRCEIHKLSATNDNNRVYFVSESLTKIKLNEDNVFVNIVKDITPRILYQEFIKLIQRAKDYDTIITILKYALLGGSEKEFRNELKHMFDEGDTERIFEEVIDKVKYNINDTCNIFNFGLGRFRFYRNHSDNFFSGKSESIMQIYKAYKISIDSVDAVEDTEIIGYKNNTSENRQFDNILDFDKSGGLKESFIGNKYKDLNQEEKKRLIDFLKGIKLLDKKDEEIDKNRHLWYDLKLGDNGNTFGYISFDWRGKEEKLEENRISNEFLAYLKRLIEFAAQSIQNRTSQRKTEIIHTINKVLIDKHEKECDMLSEFGKSICQKFNVLRFELFSYEKENIKREFIHYRDLEIEENKDLFNKINRSMERFNEGDNYFVKLIDDKLEYRVGKGIIGTAMQFFKEENKELRTLNVLNIDDFNNYKHSENNKEARKLFFDVERNCLIEGKSIKDDNGKNHLYRDLEIKNCIIAPLVLKEKLIGAIRLSNNHIDGKTYFPQYNENILSEISSQLSVRREIFKADKREKKINKIFKSLSKRFEDIEKNTVNNSFSKKLEQIHEDIYRDISGNFIEVTGASYLLNYIIKKDHNNNSFTLDKPLLNRVPKQKYYDAYCIGDTLHIKYRNRSKEDWIEINIDLNDPELKIKERSDNKLDINISRINEEYLSLLIVYNIDGIANEIKGIIESINRQISAILKLYSWIRKSNEIMDNVGHQIVSPLTGLSKHIDNIKNSYLPENDKDYFGRYKKYPEKRLFALDLIKAQTAQARNIALRNRQFISFDMGQELNISLETFNLEQSLINIASIYQPYAKSQGINSKNTIDVIKRTDDAFDNTNIHNDKTIILHIFSILIDNAIKYTNKNRDDNGIKIKITTDNISNNPAYRVEVKNYSAISIPEDKTSIIFERGVRLPNAQKSNPHGSGIGLYLIKRICNETNFEYGVESRNDDETTCFYIIIPKTLKRKTV